MRGEDRRRPGSAGARRPAAARATARAATSVRAAASEREDAGVLEHLQRQACARALEEPRRERVEAAAHAVAVGLGHVAEAEVRGQQLDVGAGARERCRELMVVPRGERRRIGEQDAHRSSVVACSSAAGTSFTATRSRRSAARFSTRCCDSRPSTTPTCSACRKCPRGRSASFTVGDVAARPVLGPLRITRAARAGADRAEPRPLPLGLLRAGQRHDQSAARCACSAISVLTLNTRRFRRRAGPRARASSPSRVSPGRRSAGSSRRSGSRTPRARRTCSRTPTARATRRTSGLPDAELLRAAWFAVVARPAGGRGRPRRRLQRPGGTLAHAARPDRRLSGASRQPGPGIDHVLVRGAPVSEVRRWPDAQRAHDDRLSVGSCAGGGRHRMSWADERARFPVLERFAYLNAGTNGPLSRRPSTRWPSCAAGRRHTVAPGRRTSTR